MAQCLPKVTTLLCELFSSHLVESYCPGVGLRSLLCSQAPGSDPRRSPRPPAGLEAHTLGPALAWSASSFLLASHPSSLEYKQGFQSFLVSPLGQPFWRRGGYLAPPSCVSCLCSRCRRVTFYASNPLSNSCFFYFHMNVNLKAMKPGSGLSVLLALAFQPHFSLTHQPYEVPRSWTLFLNSKKKKVHWEVKRAVHTPVPRGRSAVMTFHEPSAVERWQLSQPITNGEGLEVWLRCKVNSKQNLGLSPQGCQLPGQCPCREFHTNLIYNHWERRKRAINGSALF